MRRLVVVVAVVAWGACSSTPRHVPEPAVPIEVRIVLDKVGTEAVPARYAAGEPVQLHVEVINRGASTVDIIAPVLRLTDGDPWSTMQPQVRSGTGTPMLAVDLRVTHVILNVMKPPPDTVTLAPGGAWSGDVPLYSGGWSWMYGRLSTEHPGNFEPGSHSEPTLLPGHYAVAVEYSTRWTEAAVQGLADWQAVVDRAWRGSVVSNRVTLDIAP